LAEFESRSPGPGLSCPPGAAEDRGEADRPDNDRPDRTGSSWIKVIYIVGSGHSGSTLLDMIIGASANVRSVGELVYYNTYQEEKDPEKAPLGFICSCRARFRDCSFWSEVLALAGGGPPSIVSGESLADNARWLGRYLRFAAAGERRRPDPERLGEDGRLFRAVLQAGGPGTEYVCDSSKSLARLVRLLMMDGLEVFPIHLVRDPRGVAFSYTKAVRLELGLARKGFFSGLLRWIAVNMAAWLVLRLSGRPYLRLDYGELCRNPAPALNRINHSLGLKIPVEGFLEQVRAQTRHNVGGNMMRFEELVAVKEDLEWKTRLPRRRSLAGGLLAGPLYRLLKRQA
jgi:hypothetical protein